MPDFTAIGYATRDHAYLTAQRLAYDLLKSGEIRAYAVERCPDRGRVITIESSQGWDPHPMYCDPWPDDEPARYL